MAVGLFSAPERATRLVSDLSKAGQPAFQRTIRTNSDRVLQQVLLGPFGARDDAQAALERVRQMPGLADAALIER